MIRIRRGRVQLALRTLRPGDGVALLLLHELGASGESWREADVAEWPGPVHAVDFSGHGGSQWLRGGAYAPEVLAQDADGALAHVGAAALAGAGVGAYVALLVAGARPAAVPAALLLPGAGLAGGGPRPDFDAAQRGLTEPPGTGDARPGDGRPDPLTAALVGDPRPSDYAQEFATRARRLLLADDGGERPAWWEAVRRSPKAEAAPTPTRAALERLAKAVA